MNLLLINSVIELYENKKNYEKVLIEALDNLSENTGCAEDLVITKGILDKWFNLGIIDEKIYSECIEKSSVNRWF